MTSDMFGPLREQLTRAAETFADSSSDVSSILSGMVDDVEQVLTEPLEVFPVCHHSSASAMAMARRLRQKQPKVIYLELSEDLRPLLDELRHCRLPVALQAFAMEIEGLSSERAPLSAIAPITESSAEYQAISYALDTPGVELVLVDWSVDHLFQWDSMTADQARSETLEKSKESSEEAMHGDAVGLDIGDLRPGMAELEEYLLHYGKVRHWSEWWEQYVERPLVSADYDTYRQVMSMIGSLFRRLRPARKSSHASNVARERFMWTRIREHLGVSGADPAECLYICGAYHAVSRVEEFGLGGVATDFTISPRTGTSWLYGLIPSSNSAIEWQFNLAQGSVSIVAATFAKALKQAGVTAYQLEGQNGSRKRAKKSSKAAVAQVVPVVADQLTGFLSTPPEMAQLDEQELLSWCVGIVRLARSNGYLSSTADAIAVYETSILLAGMRDRKHPTPYDFQDAAVTCIEKDSVPGRRDVKRLCEILLGGDRVGQVGYSALPPLAKDVFDRLEPLGINLSKRTIQRVLIDLNKNPHLKPASELLWRLRYLLGERVIRSIMGTSELGENSVQESWDVLIAKHQRSIIEIGYEGVTVEQVIEGRLRNRVYGAGATVDSALAAVEDSIKLLGGGRLSVELGERAIELMKRERSIDSAPGVLARIRRLIAYYRIHDEGLPAWCQSFVTTGYSEYCTLLPTAFIDEDAKLAHIGAMVSFLLSMESLALSLGSDRTQLELAVAQSHPTMPDRIALRWSAQFQLGTLSKDDLRERCVELLASPLAVASFPAYLTGFIHGMDAVPALRTFVVELLSKAFAKLPDAVLVPWLPKLISTFKEQVPTLVPALFTEADRTFPARLDELDEWVGPWDTVAKKARTSRRTSSVVVGPVAMLLAAHPATTDAVARATGCIGEWQEPASATSPVTMLVSAHPTVAERLATVNAL